LLILQYGLSVRVEAKARITTHQPDRLNFETRLR